jgi:hypothetical protein
VKGGRRTLHNYVMPVYSIAVRRCYAVRVAKRRVGLQPRTNLTIRIDRVLLARVQRLRAKRVEEGCALQECRPGRLIEEALAKLCLKENV